MHRAVAVIVLVVVGLLLAGIFLSAIPVLWSYNDRARCQNNLREIGAFGVWHAVTPGIPPPADPQPVIPPGTVVLADLEPGRRLSWLVSVLPPLELHDQVPPGTAERFDLAKGWGAPANQAAARLRLAAFLCPANPPPEAPEAPAPTQYVGLGGIGADAAGRPIDAPGAGAFRYDTPTPVNRVRDGLSSTLMMGETSNDLGPWARGGPATVRGLDPDRLPYLGAGGQFAGNHPGGGFFAYADGSVRFLVEGISPALFRAQLTIAGGESDELFAD